MCGINGFSFADRQLIEAMNLATHHRGPDGSGIFVDDHISLGNNLLAIMQKPTEISVPFKSQDGAYALTYNGEIYNYKTLRTELEGLGDSFVTSGDTEVVFRGLVRFGPAFIEKLDGMFAIGFYDRAKSELVLARDRMGMKPLYYYLGPEQLIFSSELRGLLTHPIPSTLDSYGAAVFFSLGYTPGHRTLLKNIYKVPTGQYLTYNLKTKSVQLTKYAVRKKLTTEEFRPEKLRELISKAVLEHTMGLRPFGLYLSGGLDSSIILHELAQHSKSKIYSFTSRFDVDNPRFHEDADLAQKLAHHYGINHHEMLVREQDFIDSIEPATITIEEPRYNFSTSAYWLAAQRASQDITVILNGSGGDELFLGYSKYQDSQRITQGLQQLPAFAVNAWHSMKLAFLNRTWGPLLRLDRTLDRWMYVSRLGVPAKAVNRPDLHLNHRELRHYLRNWGKLVLESEDPDVENNIASFDRLWWLADEEFLRTDKLTMHFGMEGRFPLVARDVVEYAQQIPSNTKLSGEQTKSLMRRTYQELLPEYILKKPKTGWQAPAALWMGSKLYDLVCQVLSPEYYPVTADLFDFKFLNKKYLQSRRAMSAAEIKQIWPIVSFQIWAKAFKIQPE